MEKIDAIRKATEFMIKTGTKHGPCIDAYCSDAGEEKLMRDLGALSPKTKYSKSWKVWFEGLPELGKRWSEDDDITIIVNDETGEAEFLISL